MMDLVDLAFAAPAARRTDPETSAIAAERAAMGASQGRLAALRGLIEHGPLTDFELAAKTGRAQTSIGKRRGDCRDHGLVEMVMADGKPVTRPAPSGSPAIVWRITDAGRKFYFAVTPD